MKVRDDVLTSQEDIGTSGTKQWDVDYADVISGLDLRFAATNGANQNKDNPIERCVSKIEIVDGSDVLWQLPGDVAYGMYVQEHGKVPHEYYSGAQSDSPTVSIPIRFGRELYDPDLGFVPRRFKNPQLKVTFDEATVHTAGADGFVSDSITLSIVAHLMEEAPEPGAYLMTKDIYDFTSADSGDEKIPMPTDYPWRMLIVRNYLNAVAWDVPITNYKLSCDRGKFVPFDSHVRYLIDRMCEIFDVVSRSGYETADNAEYFETWMGENLSQTVHSHSGRWGVAATSMYQGRVRFSIYLDDATPGSNIGVHWMSRGWGPHNTLLIPFGRLDEMSEWFQAQSYGSVELYLTQGDADAEVNVCVQQLRGY